MFAPLRKLLQLTVEKFIAKGLRWADPGVHDATSSFVLAQIMTIIQHVTFLSVVMSASGWSTMFLIAALDIASSLGALLLIDGMVTLPWMKKGTAEAEATRVKSAT